MNQEGTVVSTAKVNYFVSLSPPTRVRIDLNMDSAFELLRKARLFLDATSQGDDDAGNVAFSFSVVV